MQLPYITTEVTKTQRKQGKTLTKCVKSPVTISQQCQNSLRVIENELQILLSVSTRGLAHLTFIIAYNADEDTPLRIARLCMLIPDLSHNALILLEINASVSAVSISNLRLSRYDHTVIVIRNQCGSPP